MKRKKVVKRHIQTYIRKKPAVGFSFLVMVIFFGIFFLLISFLHFSNPPPVLGDRTSGIVSTH